MFPFISLCVASYNVQSYDLSFDFKTQQNFLVLASVDQKSIIKNFRIGKKFVISLKYAIVMVFIYIVILKKQFKFIVFVQLGINIIFRHGNGHSYKRFLFLFQIFQYDNSTNIFQEGLGNSIEDFVLYMCFNYVPSFLQECQCQFYLIQVWRQLTYTFLILCALRNSQGQVFFSVQLFAKGFFLIQFLGLQGLFFPVILKLQILYDYQLLGFLVLWCMQHFIIYAYSNKKQKFDLDFLNERFLRTRKLFEQLCLLYCIPIISFFLFLRALLKVVLMAFKQVVLQYVMGNVRTLFLMFVFCKSSVTIYTYWILIIFVLSKS
eukprot:TRINITY_DN4181_c0_g1_i4.p3 TRINITY_DN4181_c0_g1~~TRINITY_DN4181_c0_g1_i4.p3  ORF type:complete len:320 (+),score=-1.47 TRINITY_DN4181_c0_g1_i4:284-1243(+)